MKFFALVFSAMTACVGCAIRYIPENPKCLTRCGMVLDAPDKLNENYDVAIAYSRPIDYWTCENFQKAEDEILEAYKALAKTELPNMKPFENACEQLEGYTVRVMKTSDFKVLGSEVLGLTQCPRKLMLIGNQPWYRSSLAHEMGHAIQDCKGLPPADECKDVTDKSSWPEVRACTGHYQWDVNGIDAVDRFVELLYSMPQP